MHPRACSDPVNLPRQTPCRDFPSSGLSLSDSLQRLIEPWAPPPSDSHYKPSLLRFCPILSGPSRPFFHNISPTLPLFFSLPSFPPPFGLPSLTFPDAATSSSLAHFCPHSNTFAFLVPHLSSVYPSVESMSCPWPLSTPTPPHNSP